MLINIKTEDNCKFGKGRMREDFRGVKKHQESKSAQRYTNKEDNTKFREGRRGVEKGFAIPHGVNQHVEVKNVKICWQGKVTYIFGR